MPPERRIICADPAPGARRRKLTLDINGKEVWATLDMGALSDRLVAVLPDRAQDLIEITAWIYAADAAISRGDNRDNELGRNWRRSMAFRMPVRDPAFWAREEVSAALSDAVALISDDVVRFEFMQAEGMGLREPALPFSTDEGFRPDGVALFSGGLDSLAGALEEMVSRQSRLVLVSHRSATKVQRVQADLVKALGERVGKGRLLHAPIGLNLQEGATRESTHRTRSLFFAAAATAIGRSFEIDRIRFFENGVVSLNLPPSGQVIGTRATRSTHPQALALFGRLMSLVFERKIRVENPFIWKTKVEVVELIRGLGGRDLVRGSRSCADVRNMTRASSHCGLCSQCIDRRFAMLAAGMEADDPEEAYEVDPLAGPRRTAPDREIALGYVRNARRFTRMRPAEFVGAFGEIQRAVDWLETPADNAARLLHDLHRRHGEGVTRVINAQVAEAMARPETCDPESLVRLAGLDALAGDLPARAPLAPQASDPVLTLRIAHDRKSVVVDGLGRITGAGATVIAALADLHLDALGRGLVPEDQPLLGSGALSALWNVGEEGVRRRIARLRGDLAKLATDHRPASRGPREAGDRPGTQPAGRGRPGREPRLARLSPEPRPGACGARCGALRRNQNAGQGQSRSIRSRSSSGAETCIAPPGAPEAIRRMTSR